MALKSNVEKEVARDIAVSRGPFTGASGSELTGLEALKKVVADSQAEVNISLAALETRLAAAIGTQFDTALAPFETRLKEIETADIEARLRAVEGGMAAGARGDSSNTYTSLELSIRELRQQEAKILAAQTKMACEMAIRATSTAFDTSEAQAVLAKQGLKQAHDCSCDMLLNVPCMAGSIDQEAVRSTKDKLHAAILLAEGTKYNDTSDLVKATLRKMTALTRLLHAMTSQENPAELQAAILVADETELHDGWVGLAQSCLTSMQQKSAARNKLRVAMSWATSTKFDGLQEAIRLGEEVGLREEEIHAARSVLADLRKGSLGESKEETRRLLTFLSEAKPTWTTGELQSALKKLKAVGVHTVDDLALALSDYSKVSLVSRMKAADVRVFASSTIDALRAQAGIISGPDAPSDAGCEPPSSSSAAG